MLVSTLFVNSGCSRMLINRVLVFATAKRRFTLRVGILSFSTVSRDRPHRTAIDQQKVNTRQRFRTVLRRPRRRRSRRSPLGKRKLQTSHSVTINALSQCKLNRILSYIYSNTDCDLLCECVKIYIKKNNK